MIIQKNGAGKIELVFMVKYIFLLALLRETDFIHIFRLVNEGGSEVSFWAKPLKLKNSTIS